MSRAKKYTYPRVKIPGESQAWEILKKQAAYYGKSEGELIADIAISWTKMVNGELNLHWSLFTANGVAPTTSSIQQTPPSNTQKEKEEEEKKRQQEERLKARRAAARAEALDDL